MGIKQLLKVGKIFHKYSEKNKMDSISVLLELWKASFLPLCLFAGIGYWYMVYNRELKMKYKFLCYEINLCREKIEKIEKKKLAIETRNKDNDKSESVTLGKIKLILEKFLNF
jgi:hypothetical protein